MFHFRQRSSDAVYGVLIDISSGSVGVAIVMSHVGEIIPKILYTHRNTMRITKHSPENQTDLRRLREALFSALLTLSQEGKQVLSEYDSRAIISKLYVTCSAPWSYTVARTVNLENDEPIKITNTIINDLVQSAETEIINHLREVSHMSVDSFSIVERATVDITVNEYAVSNPLNLKGTSLSLSHVAGVIPEDILSAIREVQEKLFPDTTFRAHTYMLIMYCVMRDIFPRINSMCIINITAESTEFAVVEKGLLIENASTPTGSTTFVRNVMETTNKPSADVQSHMSHVGDDSHLTTADFEPHTTEYVNKLTELIVHIMSHRAIPSNIIITAHKPFEHFFVPLIGQAFERALHTQPHILSIREGMIKEISDGADEDVYLALAARFFHKLHTCGELDYK